MQYDMARFDQPLVDETQPKAYMWTDIGEAEVEHGIFGHAKVRVYRKRDEVRGALRWAIFMATLVAGAIWLIHDRARHSTIVYVAPVAEKAAPAPTAAAPLLKPRVVQQPVAQRSTVFTAPVVAVPVTGPLTTPAVPLTAASAPAVAKPVPVIVKPAPLPATEKLIAPVAPAVQAKPAVAQSAVSAPQ